MDSEIALFYGRTLNKTGVYVVNLDPSGAIAKAGINKEDIITGLDNFEIKTMLDLRTAVYNYKVGDTVELTFLREGVERKISLTLTRKNLA